MVIDWATGSWLHGLYIRVLELKERWASGGMDAIESPHRR